MTTREQAIQWWNALGSASKTSLVDTNTELLIKGITRRWETLTGSEIEEIFRKETKTTENEVPQNIYLNRLKEQYKALKEKQTVDSWSSNKMYYDAMRLFCLDTQLVSFNDIELMEFEINSSF